MSSSASSLPKEVFGAGQRGELQKVVKWLRKGGHVDALCSWEDEQGRRYSSALLHGAAANGQLAVAKELLKRGATVNLPGSIGATPLMTAAASGHLAVLLPLLEYSANPDLQNVECGTALMAAAGGGHEECAKALLRANANTELRDKNGHTALQHAEHNGNTAVAELIRRHTPRVRPPASVSPSARLPSVRCVLRRSNIRGGAARRRARRSACASKG